MIFIKEKIIDVCQESKRRFIKSSENIYTVIKIKSYILFFKLNILIQKSNFVGKINKIKKRLFLKEEKK